MKLQSFKVQEISSTELRNISGGGIISSIGYAIGYVAGTFVEPIHDSYENAYNEECGCN